MKNANRFAVRSLASRLLCTGSSNPGYKPLEIGDYPPLSPSSYVLLLGKLSFNISVCTRCPPRNLWHRTPRRPIFVSLHTHGLLHPLAAVVLLYESCCIARGEKSRSRGCNNFEGWKRYNFASDDLLGLYHLYKIWSRLSLIEEWIWFDRFVNQIANRRESNPCEIFIVYFVFC